MSDAVLGAPVGSTLGGMGGIGTLDTGGHMNGNSSQAWAYYTHADNVFAGRINFFLVAEAMLVAAFVTLPATESQLRILVSTLALIYTACWFYVNARLAKRMASLVPELKKDPLFEAYLRAAKGPSGLNILSYVPPLSTIAFWLLLLFRTL